MLRPLLLKIRKKILRPRSQGPRPTQVLCSNCGAPMECNPYGGCWCKRLPPMMQRIRPGGCLCCNCLTAQQGHNDHPAPGAAASDAGERKVTP